MANSRFWVQAAAVVMAGATLATACGDDGDAADSDETTTTTVAADDTTTTATDDDTTTTTEAPATTTTLAAIATMDVDDIPDLVTEWADGSRPTLDLVTDIIGFPIAVGPPSDGGAYNLQVDMEGSDPAEPWTWDWFYETIAADPTGNIDIALDDNGPGSVALREFYDPAMADLGWSYSNSTGSDPSSGAGGPQSINHVYQSDSGTIALGPVEGAAKPMFVWASEHLGFSDEPDLPGYRIGLSADAPADDIHVPMLAALADDIPVIADARLIDISLRSQQRSDDSFSAEYGLRYFEIEFTYELTPDSAVEAQQAYLDALPSGIYQAGEESFFEPGTIESADPIEVGDRWTQSVVVLDRYEGSIEVEPDPETGDTTSTVSIRLEPIRAVLAASTE